MSNFKPVGILGPGNAGLASIMARRLIHEDIGVVDLEGYRGCREIALTSGMSLTSLCSSANEYIVPVKPELPFYVARTALSKLLEFEHMSRDVHHRAAMSLIPAVTYNERFESAYEEQLHNIRALACGFVTDERERGITIITKTDEVFGRSYINENLIAPELRAALAGKYNHMLVNKRTYPALRILRML